MENIDDLIKKIWGDEVIRQLEHPVLLSLLSKKSEVEEWKDSIVMQNLNGFERFLMRHLKNGRVKESIMRKFVITEAAEQFGTNVQIYKHFELVGGKVFVKKTIPCSGFDKK